MPDFRFLIVLLFLIHLAVNDELTACDTKTCSCSEYKGGGAKSIRCPDFINCTVDIQYKQSEVLEVQCLSNTSFIDELEFNFGEIKIVRITDCNLPRGLNIFEKWNLTNVKELMLKRIFDFGAAGVIRNDFFDRTPKGSIEKLYIKICNVKAIEEEAFKGFSNLTRLDLEENELKQLPDIFKHIPMLRELDLQRNLIQSLPKGITAPNLKTLYLNVNNITSLDEAMFERTPNLVLLELSANRISSLPQDLLRPLKELRSVNFGLGGPVSVEELFVENTNLSTVRFRGGNITFISPGAFRKLPKLQTLTIYDSKLREVPKDLFMNNENLESIILSENNVIDLPEEIFGNLNKLKKLDLSGNNFTKWRKEYFNKGLKNLEQLNLSKNKIEVISDLVFTELPKLKTVKLNYNKIKEIAREAFDAQSSITELYLNVNNLYADDEESFNYLTNLVKLDLNNNSYDTTPSINHIVGLKRLSMRNNKIEKVMLIDIVGIQNVDLTGNRITTVDFSFFNLATENETRTSRKLILNKNPFSCDCAAYDFFEWISRTDPRLSIETDNLKCATPSELMLMPIQNISSKDLMCNLRQLNLRNENLCPESCHCTLYPVNATLHIDCSDLNLTSIPHINAFLKPLYAGGVNYKKSFVDLSGNKIKTLTKNINYTYVSGLDLSGNDLKAIEWVPKDIKILKLHRNKLSYINNEVLSTLINNTFLQTLTLDGNPWFCDCLLTNLTNAVRVNFRYLLGDTDTLQCDDGQLLIHVTETELCKQDTTLIIALCVFIGVLLLLLAFTLMFYYKYETTVKIWLFSHNLFLQFITEEEVDKNKKYDAFISYSHKDESFIVQHILPELEGGTHPYKLCYHERDWEVGEFINRQIIESVANSRRTIIVLSKHFLESTWAATEFQTAHHQAMNEKRNRLIVILYDDIKPEDVKDEELRSYLKTNTYIKWGDAWFWRKLRYAMPHDAVKKNEKVEKAKQRIENIMISIDDKLDLTTSPATPNTQTPPAMSLDPLLLKGYPLQFKSEKNESKIISTQIC